mgnify:CR=1 FL=1
MRSFGANPLKGLQIQAIRLTLHEVTLPEDPFGMLADLPPSAAGFPTAMKQKLYNSSYRKEDGTFTVPEVTLAGKTLSEADAYFAALCFDLSDGDDLTCDISAIVIGEKGSNVGSFFCLAISWRPRAYSATSTGSSNIWK